ncbi:MAG: Spy/CpxP family protein refolding chaperone [Gammaproteobacteria bacterium]
MKKTALTLITSAALMGSGVALANPPAYGSMSPAQQCGCANPHKPMQGHLNKMDRLAIKLNLTQEQRDSIRSQLKALQSQKEKYRDQLVMSMQTLRQLAQAGVYKGDKVEAAAKQKGDAITQLTELKMQSKGVVMNVLTPEQQKQFKEMRAERMKKFHTQ